MIYFDRLLFGLFLRGADVIVFIDLAIYLYNKTNVIALKFPSVLCPIKKSATAVQHITIAQSRSGNLIPDTKLLTINAIPVM